MKRIVFFLLLLCSNLFGHGNRFTVSGKVTDCRTKEAIPGVTLKLIGSDKSSVETNSDSQGNYSFSNCFQNNIDYIIKTQVNDSIGRGIRAKYGVCPGEMTEKFGYSNSSDKIKFTYSDTLSIKKYDLCLIQIIGCGSPPTFYFKKNSTDFSSVEYVRLEPESIDTTIDCYVTFLMVNKKWVLVLAGNASSDETNKKELAAARAEKLRDVFVSKGIDKERLVCESYSDSRVAGYSMDDGTWITNDKNDARNRRIDISLLRRDYDPLTKKPKVYQKDEK